MEHVSDPHQSTYMLQHAIEEWQHVRLFIFPCRISTAIVHLKDEQVSHYLTVVELSRPSKLSNLLDKPMFAYSRESLAPHKDQLHALQVLNLGSPLKISMSNLVTKPTFAFSQKIIALNKNQSSTESANVCKAA